MRNETRADDRKDEERQGLRILIADDHSGSRRALQLVLRWLKCPADVAENGREAVEAVRARDYDIVFMDVVMPRMDGLEATRRIRRDCSGAGGGPRIVGMSADGTSENRDVCLRVGMDEFLPKPIDVEALVRILDSVALGPVGVC